MVLASLQGLPAFVLYFCVAIVLVTVYVLIYTRVTAHDEFALIAADKPAGAVALGLSLLGFAIPVASAIGHSANVIDCAVWGLIALLVQVIVYYIVRIPVPDLSQRIGAGELAPAIWLGLASVTAGLLSAAAMTY